MAKCACQGSFLEKFVQPYVLVILNKNNLHGFSIYKELIASKAMDYSGIDPTGLYRTLKKMEENGLLSSEWDFHDGSQPKKIYKITDTGRKCLLNWKKTLESYKKEIENLHKVIAESLGE